MLFYHIYLRCYVILELNVRPFDPEYAGKLYFFVNAVNEFIRKDSDNPSLLGIDVLAEMLRKYYSISGLPLKRFFNTSGIPYREMELSKKLPEMSEDEQLALLATDGMLVKRPLIVGNGFVLTGFKEEEWAAKLK